LLVFLNNASQFHLYSFNKKPNYSKALFFNLPLTEACILLFTVMTFLKGSPYEKLIDFLILDKDRISKLIQATYASSKDEMKKREIKALMKSLSTFKMLP